jgi:histidine triad (HIT) family protein
MASIFTRILNNELPSYRIHEDELTFSILTLQQIQLGHTLVIPKLEVNHWYEVPENYLLQVEKNGALIAQAIRQATGCVRVLKAAIGFEVPHYHLHLVPAWSMADLNFSAAKQFSDDECRAIQAKIRALL